MRILLRCSTLILVVGLVACGGDDDTVPAAPPSGSSGHSNEHGDGGDTSSDAGSDSGIGPVDNGDAGTGTGDGPLIDILAPEAATDPNTDMIVTSSTVTVRCKVTRSQSRFAHDVNPSSVAILAKSGKDALTGVVTAQADDVFEADFNLADFKNGPLSFTCSADDVAMPAHTGTTTIDTFLDLGPEIVLLDPMDMGTYALTGKLAIRFQVKESKVAGNDKEAAPKNIKLEASGQNVKITESASEHGLYTASVNYNDRKLFPMAPTSSAISITAASSRTPKAPVRKERADITLDADGPTIAVNAPGYMTIVRGDVVLSVTVSDPAGIKMDSITGTINNDLYALTEWKNNGGGNFTTHFDTVPFGTKLTMLTINIKASDEVGNESTIDHILRLDNVPPLISLDPPNIRIGVRSSTTCSVAFDPVGDDAKNDLDKSDYSGMYRVEVRELTNHSPDANIDYVAGVKDGTVKIFAQEDPNIPLLIDTNGDGQCDEINSDALAENERPTQLTLQSLSVRGTPPYLSTATFGPNDPPWCTAGGLAPPLPSTLCAATALTYAAPQPIEGVPPAIYGIGPTNNDGGACEGNTWELLPIVGEGWKCIAARVEDKIGNVGVSRPLRICFDDGDGTPDCDPMTQTPPDCRDNCTLPPDFPADDWVILR
jgi:hypothetical protein